MNLIQIREQVDDRKNILFYNRDIYTCYNEFMDDYLCIYFNEPLPVKLTLIECINKISDSKRESLKRLTVAELRKIFVKELKYERLVIFFNHFERLTKRDVDIHLYLNSLKNVQYICSFKGEFKSVVYPFYQHFILVNKEEYDVKSGKDEVDVTYPVFLGISFVGFLVYIKVGTTSMAAGIILLGALWFAFLIFRTLVYVGGRR